MKLHKKQAVLLIEDDPLVRDIISEFVSFLIDPSIIKKYLATDVIEAKRILSLQDIILVITDVNLGTGPDGLCLAEELNNCKKRPYIIVISSIPGLIKPEELLAKNKIDALLSKPFSLSQLEQEIKKSETFSIKKQICVSQ